MVQQKIPLTAIVFNDNAYGNVKRIQQMRFGGRTIASDLLQPGHDEARGRLRRRGPARQHAGGAAGDPARRASPGNEPVLIEVPVGPMPQMQFAPPPPRPAQS